MPKRKEKGAFDRLVQGLYVLLLAAGCYYLGVYLYQSWFQVPYPYFLDWTEGNMFLEAMQIRKGLPIYTAPTLSYVPNLYTPFYFYLTALFTFFTQPDFIAGRLVSFLSTLGLCASMYVFLRKEKVPQALSLAGPGLYLATYQFSSEWFNIIRPDSLLLFLLMMGWLMLRHGKTTASSMAAGLLFALAFYTKQPGAVIAAFILLGHMALRPRHTIIASLSFACFGAGLAGFSQWSSHGGFFFYTFEMPSHHALRTIYPSDQAGHAPPPANVRSSFLGVTISSFLGRPLKLFPFFGLIGLALAFQFRKSWREACALLGPLMGFLLATVMGILHTGGYLNNYLPACMVLTLLSVRALMIFPHRFRFLFVGGLVVLLCQCVVLYGPLKRVRPAPDARTTLDHYLESIGKIPGDVLIMNYNFFVTRVGKKPYGWGSAGWDLLRMDVDHPVKTQLLNSLVGALNRKEFEALYLEGWELKAFSPTIQNNYVYAGEALPRGVSLQVGEPMTPAKIYKRRPETTAGGRARAR